MVCKIAKIIVKWQASPILKSIHGPKKKTACNVYTFIEYLLHVTTNCELLFERNPNKTK
jgi:hypothetical protein